MLPATGSVVWIDGDSPALVVGHGVDADNIGDGRIFVVELGSVTALAPDDEGVYNFGSAPYDREAKPGLNDRGQTANPGGFTPDSPVVAATQETAGVNAAPSSSSGAPLTPGAPGEFVGDAEPGTGTGPDNPAVPAFSNTTAGDTLADTGYRDNGDGTFTRTSDGAVGTFGPGGFVVKTSSPSSGI